ncbi:MAG: tetratricopeptide repeat protein [Deltaproteobacteria bacterium]|nr:tetratricopeptide repeat protein [Deltaproteobacteria bacterium]
MIRHWETAGLVATLLLALALPLYLWHNRLQPATRPQLQAPTFVGRQVCAKCHQREEKLFAKSDHDLAMAVASDQTVLGDFDNATFTLRGVTSRFFRRDGKFFVHTRGPDGIMADFQVTHTFGWTPLQQYLVPFSGGRLQCLPLAWDCQQKRWFHLYAENPPDPDDWNYWTNRGQTWNNMCADCHSTNFRKGYDCEKDVYNSSYTEINVSCEACHGPGSRHVAWAETLQPQDSDNGLVVHTGKMSAQQQVELCAFCHSRRSALRDFHFANGKLLASLAPRLLEEPLYYADGQIRDEVYVYNSFQQSKMYARGIRCSDCHDIHSLKLHREGNQLCLQCHQADIYNRYSHHFHKQKGDRSGRPLRAADGSVSFAVGTGASCVGCHMPGRTYMGNDYRPDHSLRLPRPALNRALDSPDACLRCHQDKNRQWSINLTRKWYGEKNPAHYGTTLAAGRQTRPEARGQLLALVKNRLYPTVVRATALKLLGRYRGEEVTDRFQQCLESDEALLRRTALLYMPGPAGERGKASIPLLNDPVRGVRIEAARNLSEAPDGILSSQGEKHYGKVLAELCRTLEYRADFADSRTNLGILHLYRKEPDAAAAAFKKAIAIDRHFYEAYRNLAILYSRRNEPRKAEEILRQALALDSSLYDIHYSLGLLLAERKHYPEALEHLQLAADGLPGNARVHYNLGRLLAFLGKNRAATKALGRAVAIAPRNLQYLEALARLQLRENHPDEAVELARKLIAIDPANPTGLQILKHFQKR